MTGAVKDCEDIVDVFFGQPVNSVTALAFLVAGLLIVSRTGLTWVGIASMANGVGSFLFHGPMPPLSEWLHDVTLAWLLLVVASWGRPWETWARLPGLAALALVIAIPGTGDPIGVVLAAAAVVSLLTRDRSAATIAPVALLVVAAIIGRLGTTGGPLCDPTSIWQPHGLWHLGAAAALTWWSLATGASPTRQTQDG